METGKHIAQIAAVSILPSWSGSAYGQSCLTHWGWMSREMQINLVQVLQSMHNSLITSTFYLSNYHFYYFVFSLKLPVYISKVLINKKVKLTKPTAKVLILLAPNLLLAQRWPTQLPQYHHLLLCPEEQFILISLCITPITFISFASPISFTAVTFDPLNHTTLGQARIMAPLDYVELPSSPSHGGFCSLFPLPSLPPITFPFLL